MKSKFKGLNFESVEVLSREQQAKVKGGYQKILCSFTIWYSLGNNQYFSVSSLAPCSRANLSDCNGNLRSDLECNYPGASNYQGYGCYSVG
jgi:hypothetical protein